MNLFSITDAQITSPTISLFGSHTKSVSQANLKGITVRYNCVHNHLPHKEEPITLQPICAFLKMKAEFPGGMRAMVP